MNKKNALEQLNKPLDITTLTPEQVRVEVAKDVIASLIIDKITPDAGTYGSLTFVEPLPANENVSLREKIPSMKACSVCAMGSLMMAFVSRFNNFSVHTYGTNHVGFTSDSIRQTLSPYFTSEQLSLMEKAYGDFTFSILLTQEQVSKAHNFFVKENDGHDASYENNYVRGKERLVAIMQNIVDNDGTFNP
jgi:hypothetical protein